MSGGTSPTPAADTASGGLARVGESPYREIFDVLEDAVVVHDAKTGEIVDVNAGACALFGYDGPTLLSLPIGALSAVDEGYTEERAAVHIREALAKGKVRLEWRSRRADGRVFWTEVRLVRSEIGGESRVVAIVRDINVFKEANEKLRLVEERYRVLVRSMPNSAVVLCDHDLRLVLVDGPEVNASGMSKAAMEGRTIHEAFTPEFATLIEGNMRRMLSGEAFSAELPFEDKWFLYNYVPLRDDDGRVIYGLILSLNVTERRRAEDALRQSEQRFAKIFQSSPNAIGVTRRSDGVLLEVNPSFERLLGWSPAEAVGKTSTELGYMVEVERRPEVLAGATASSGIDGVEILARRKDGSVVTGLLSVRPIEFDKEPCFLFTFRDITEERRARQELEASEARLRALVDSTFEGIGISDRGLIVDANDQLARMFGMTREEMLGTGVADLVAPEARAVVQEHILAGNEGPYEHVAMRADGTRFSVEVRARRTVVGGRALRMSAIRDITERKSAELERERLITELRSRNAEMEQFTYTVSHDLKSPLVTISGFLGMLEQDIADGSTERVRADIARIGSAASRMMRLLNDLLELSRVGRVGRVPSRVRLGDVVQDALELVSGAIAERRVRVVLPELGLPEVYGDRARLSQVVQNLLENAVKYIGTTADPVIEIGVRPDEQDVVWFVRDNGIGIEPKYAERIFGLFEKLDPRSDGTGVGLALVRRIMEFHGGRAWVESDGRNGSTFVLRMPRGGPVASADGGKESS